ncbi:unnamed protein product [Allacma fusca]|uniref:CRAL-TRIO domain-containing protein n=1 Tax=Allacma fusca TaxID=39272 RepID=A0A8J2J9F0_9HEXA|nr:unnamed protein product [Allacma fusca]
MAPISSTLYVLILIYFSFSTISFVKAQIPNDEVPAELQFLTTGEYDTWTPPSDIAKNYPYYLSGFDDQNRPIWVLEFGKWDIRAALLKDEEYVKALDMHIDQATWNFFTSTVLRASPDAPNKEFIVLIDAEGYNLAQLNSAKAVSFVVRKLTMITIATRFASSVYAVNVNFAAERLLSLLKPFLGREFEKFIIFGTNSAMYIYQRS